MDLGARTPKGRAAIAASTAGDWCKWSMVGGQKSKVQSIQIQLISRSKHSPDPAPAVLCNLFDVLFTTVIHEFGAGICLVWPPRVFQTWLPKVRAPRAKNEVRTGAPVRGRDTGSTPGGHQLKLSNHSEGGHAAFSAIVFQHLMFKPIQFYIYIYKANP